MAEANGRWAGRGRSAAPEGRGLFRVRLGVEVFTTGMIAGMAGVSPKTVYKWFDSGDLPGWHLHGTGRDRRVARADLLAFARRTGQRGLLLALEAARGGALACGVPDHALPPGVDQAPSFFALGMAFAGRRPRAVLLGPLHGRGVALEACLRLAAAEERPRVVGLAAEDDDGAGWREAGCAAVLRLPCSVEDVRAAMGEGVAGG
jgi:AcrR family transcriptional regulator